MGKSMRLAISMLIMTLFLLFGSGAFPQSRSDEPLTLKCTMKEYPEVTIETARLVYPQAPLTIIPSVRTVLSLTLDGKGNLWVGTDNGLIAHDTKSGNWQLFNTQNGLSFNRITSLEADGKYIWIGASPLITTRPENGGLMRRTEGDRGFECFGRRAELTCNWINSMLLHNSILYLGTKNGLAFFDTKGQRCIYNREGVDVRLMFVDGINLWIEAATSLPRSTEILQYNLDTKVSTPMVTKSTFGFDRLSSIAFDGTRIWIAGSRLVSNSSDMSRPRETFSFDSDGLKVYEPTSRRLRDVVLPQGLYRQWIGVQKRGSTIWLFSDRGFGTLNGEELTFYLSRTQDKASIPRLVDNGTADPVWMANQEGLMRFSGQKITCYRFNNTLSDNYITSMAMAHGGLWAGTGKGSINRIDGTGDAVSIYDASKGLSCRAVEDIFLDIHERLYALCAVSDEGHGTHRSVLYRYDPGEDRWSPSPSFEGDRVTTCQAVSMRHFSLLERLKLETPAGRVLFLENKGNSWLSTFGGGLVKMPKGSENLR
jgi:hypothetical protein